MHTGTDNEICSCSWTYSGNLILWITSSSFTINSVMYVKYFWYQVDKCSASTFIQHCQTSAEQWCLQPSHAAAVGSRGMKFWLWSQDLGTNWTQAIIFVNKNSADNYFSTSLALSDSVCIISEQLTSGYLICLRK